MTEAELGLFLRRDTGSPAAPIPAWPLAETRLPQFQPDMARHPQGLPPRLSVVAPCYNEQDCLREFCAQICAEAQALVGTAYEIVLIDDGSADATPAILRDLAGQDAHIVVVTLSRNFGHQKALSAGLHLCRGDRVLIIDADLQDPPQLLPAMMQAMDAGADVVYGQRRIRAGETRFKTTSAALFYRLLRKLTEIDIPADCGDFRLMNRRTVEIFKTMPEQFMFVRGMISWIGLKQVPVLYDRASRHAGETGYTLRKMTGFAMDALTGFSIVPLRLVTWFGLIASAASLLLSGYAVARWLCGATVAGWTSLACITLVIGGAQLLFLGILGEYVGRIYMEQKRRPLFVISDVFRKPAD